MGVRRVVCVIRPHVPTPEELEQGLVPDATPPEREESTSSRVAPTVEPPVHQLKLVIAEGVGERLPGPVSAAGPVQAPTSATAVASEVRDGAAPAAAVAPAAVPVQQGPAATTLPRATDPGTGIGPAANEPGTRPAVARARGRRVEVAVGTGRPRIRDEQIEALAERHVAVLLGASTDAADAAGVLRILIPLARDGRAVAAQKCLNLSRVDPLITDCVSWLAWADGWPGADLPPRQSFDYLPHDVAATLAYIAGLPARPTPLRHYVATAEERGEALAARRALDQLCVSYPGLRAVLDAEVADPTGNGLVRAMQGLPGRYDDPALVAARPHRAVLAQLRDVVGHPPRPCAGAVIDTGQRHVDAVVMEALASVPDFRWRQLSVPAAEEALRAPWAGLSGLERAGYGEVLRSLGVGIPPDLSAAPQIGASGGVAEPPAAPADVSDRSDKRREAARRAAQTRAQRRLEQEAEQARLLADAERRREARREAARKGAATRKAEAARRAAEEELQRAKRQDAARRAAQTRAARQAAAATMAFAAPNAACAACGKELVLKADVAAKAHSACLAPEPAPEPRGLFSKLRRRRRASS